MPNLKQVSVISGGDKHSAEENGTEERPQL